MEKSVISNIESSSLQHGKNKSSVIYAEEVKNIQERVNKNFDEFKRIKWLNARNSSKEHRKGAQQFLKLR